MNLIGTCLIGLAGLVTPASVWSDDPDKQGQVSSEIQSLIRKLGSNDFAEREAATRRLLELRRVPHEAIKEGATSLDPEIRRRCQALLAALSKRMSHRTFGLALGQDARTALVGSSDEENSLLWLEESQTGAEVISFKGLNARLSRGALSRDGRLAVTTGFGKPNRSRWGLEDCPIILWDLGKGQEIRRFEGHGGGVGRVEFSADEKTLISSGYDFTARTWEVATGKQIACFKGHTTMNVVCCATLTRDGLLAASGGIHDGTIRLWDPKTGMPLRTIEIGETDVGNLRFDSAGQRLAVGTGHERDNKDGKSAYESSSIRLVDVKTGKELRHFRGHEGPICALSYSPDEKRLVSGSADFTVRVWDIESGKQVACFKTKEKIICHVVVSAEGRRVSCLSDNGVFEQFDMP